MPESSSIRDTIRGLYKVLLGREASYSDLLLHEQGQEAGGSLEVVISGIANSAEAKQRQIERQFGSMTVSEAMAHALPLNATTLVRVDDVMHAIAKAYEIHLARQPSFNEVYQAYADFRQGSPLAGVLAAIAESDEARAATARRAAQQDGRERFAKVMDVIYRRCLHRSISDEEVDIWLSPYQSGLSYGNLLLSIDQCEEAQSLQTSREFPEWTAGTFVQLAFELLLQRGATPREICYYQGRLGSKTLSRQDILAQLFMHAGRTAVASKSDLSTPANDPTRANLFGIQDPVDISMWTARSAELAARIETAATSPPFSRFLFTSAAAPLVSVITSLYKGGRFIEAFLENITSQSIFQDHCELLIIDADSPDGEFEKAAKYLKSFSNIKYKRCTRRIGIYEAWNLGVENARGDYCTNANLDDCRRRDSFELQAATLDALPFVDVVYQDVFYSFEANLPFETIANHGFSTSLPIVSRYNLMEFNMPHNGPMWRKNLHSDVGMFNSTYTSAGDFDFWIRCLANRKTFYKLNDPHIAYYVNPQGLSTRADTPGAVEASATTRRYYRELVSDNLTMENAAFADRVRNIAHTEVDGEGRYRVAQAALREIARSSHPRLNKKALA